MTKKSTALLLTALSSALLAPAGQAVAQTPAFPVELPADAPSAPAALTPAQIEKLVAPIALYPDPVLTDILAAATYPAQIVEAARFALANQGLQGVALTNAAAAHNWDPSVQALLAFPAVLHMLDGDLEWTDQLGRAFMTQQGDVLDAIQHLRLSAERAGTLQNGPDASVVNDGGAISINSPSPQAVYLPSYDAGCVYGGDLAGCSGPADTIGWDDGIFLPYGFEQWGLVDWGHRHIRTSHGAGGWHGGGGWQGHGGWHGGGRGSWHGGSSRSGANDIGGVGPHDTGEVWGHTPIPGFTGHLGAGSSTPYAYAPPAGEVQPGYGVPRPAMMTGHFAPAGMTRSGGMPVGARMAHGPAAPAPMARVGMAPSGFGGHR